MHVNVQTIIFMTYIENQDEGINKPKTEVRSYNNMSNLTLKVISITDIFN